MEWKIIVSFDDIRIISRYIAILFYFRMDNSFFFFFFLLFSYYYPKTETEKKETRGETRNTIYL